MTVRWEFVWTETLGLTSFVPVVERDGIMDRAKLETALSRGFCIVRWHLKGARP
jgi:hypothetical protein